MTIRSLVKRQFLLGPSLVVTAIVLVAALSYRLVQGRLAAFAASFYGSTQSGLYPFLAARVIGYRTFLWVLLGLLGAWCLTLWADPLSKRREASVAARVPASLLWKVFFLVVLVFLATVAVLLSQREWVRFGRPCWDNYCVYSELIASCLQHPSSETWEPLRTFMHRDYHANSPFVPLLVAGTNLISGMEIIRSYRILCLAATTLGLFVLFRVPAAPAVGFLPQRRSSSSCCWCPTSPSSVLLVSTDRRLHFLVDHPLPDSVVRLHGTAHAAERRRLFRPRHVRALHQALVSPGAGHDPLVDCARGGALQKGPCRATRSERWFTALRSS